jgi:hypothetical protein
MRAQALASPVTATLVLMMCFGSRAVAAEKSTPTDTPTLAVVALREQRITIYSGSGKLMQASVSTGRSGYETPAGVFSILEKRREHYSNLYDDASMPFMQRLTWSGIALHAGALPGRPASHGCIRLPHGFAAKLFDLTRVGMRVVVVPSDIAPVEVVHPLLFKPGPIVSEPNVASMLQQSAAGDESMHLGAAPPDLVSARTRTWRAIAAERSAAAAVAIKAATEAKSAAARALADATAASQQLRVLEAEAQAALKRLEAAQRSIAAARSARASERAEKDKIQATERLAETKRKLEALTANMQPRIDAVPTAREAASAAEAAKIRAQGATRLAEAKLAPVSVFISRKTQRLYVRQGLQPVFDAPVTIRDPDMPTGTTTFTASRVAGEGELRWSVLAMARPGSVGAHGRQVPTTDIGTAMAVLDRISIAPDVIARINEVTSLGASLIVSDEAAHPRETGTGTDFIVVLSGEPQGGLTIRPRSSSRSERQPLYPRSPSNRFFWW